LPLLVSPGASSPASPSSPGLSPTAQLLLHALSPTPSPIPGDPFSTSAPKTNSAPSILAYPGSSPIPQTRMSVPAVQPQAIPPTASPSGAISLGPDSLSQYQRLDPGGRLAGLNNAALNEVHLSDGQSDSPEAVVRGYAAGYDAANEKDANAKDPDELRGQYARGVDPSANAYAGALVAPPAYQTPHMNPWAMLALALGGAATNALEPHHQNGAEMVTGTLQGLQQGAQDRYAVQKDQYQQRLQNAQSQYGLAKDRNQNLLDQADQADKAASDDANNRRTYILNRIMQANGQDADKALTLMKTAADLEAQKTSEDWQSKQNDLTYQRELHLGLIKSYVARGNKNGLADAAVADYMEGRPHMPDGTPIDPADAARVKQLRADILSRTPQDAAEELIQRINEETLKQSQLANKTAQEQLDANEQFHNGSIEKTKPGAGRAGQGVDLGRYRSSIRGFDGDKQAAYDQVTVAHRSLTAAGKAYNGALPGSNEDANSPKGRAWARLNDARAKAADADAKEKSITPGAYAYTPGARPASKQLPPADARSKAIAIIRSNPEFAAQIRQGWVDHYGTRPDF
jgi:hypothetical protein